jgi:hypothetical protein
MSGVWGEPEEESTEVETFGDAMAIEAVAKGEHSGKFSGDPDQIAAPELEEMVSGDILIKAGWHGEDYVWHLCPSNPRMLFKASQEGVLRSCAAVMSKIIPESVQVKMWTPLADWDIQEYTIKALDLKAAWQIQDKHLKDINTKLFEVLNTLV